MPTRTVASPGRTHSCSLVYFRSSGYTALLVGCWSVLGSVLGRCSRSDACQLSGAAGLGVARRRGLAGGGDVDLVQLADFDLAADPLHLGDEAAGEVQGGGQRVRVADRVDGVRRLQLPAVDEQPAVAVDQGRLRDHPHLVVELDDLRAGVAQL